MNYYLIHTTYPILFVAVFARQLCIAVPAILFLLSAGALAGSGKLNYGGVLAVAVLGCVLADLVWFEAGRLRGPHRLQKSHTRCDPQRTRDVADHDRGH
jgi:membrane protein DedA with SNARE-associated domain